MLRRNQLIGTAILALACSLPAPAAMSQVDLRNPDSRQATPPRRSTRATGTCAIPTAARRPAEPRSRRP